jgi:diguanylate cyclase (GGDEF)-like protein
MRSFGLQEAASPSGFVWHTEHRLLHALDRLSCGVILIDPTDRLVHLNSACRGFLPTLRDDLKQGAMAAELFREAVRRGDIRAERGLIERWLEDRTTGEPPPLNVRLRDDRWLKLEARQSFDQGTVLTLLDVTEFKRREVWLTELHDRLAGEGEDLKVFARHLATAKAEATEALRKAEQANAALAHEIAERKLLEERLWLLANTDPLTGALNRRRFLELLEGDARRPQGKLQTLAVLMLDLDYFKKINDRFGHATGDDALRHFTALAKAELRDRDHFARLGGEEFAAILPATTLDGALLVAERIRAATERALFEDENGVKVPLSVSIGATELEPDDERPLAVLNRADKALYLTKESGRNRVAKATTSAPPELVGVPASS